MQLKFILSELNLLKKGVNVRMKCKFEKLEQKDLFKKSITELQECGCPRCEAVAKELELDELRRYKQEQEALKAAEEQAAKIAEEIINKSKEVENEIEEKVASIVEQKLNEAGVNLSNKYTRRLIEQKMHYDAMMNKNVYANTRYGREVLSPEMKAFVHWAKTGQLLDQKAALVGTTDANGGYLVPTEFYNEVIRKMEPLTVVRRSGARVITMSRDKMDIPVVDSKGAGAWRGTAQGQQYTQSEPTFSNITLEPKKYDRLVLASYEMLEDSAVNVAELLAELIAEDFALAEDDAFIAGDGTNAPEGIDTNANVAIKNLATAGAVTAQDIVGLVYSLPRQYRNGAVWYIHDSVIAKLRLLQDGAGQYIWTDGNFTNGEPPRLLGYPVFPTNAHELTDWDDAGAGTGSGSRIIFGNPRYYYIGDRQGFRLRRSTERYFETGQVAFAADRRVDGKVALPEAFVKSSAVQH
jgi:HK97 family phage major capsid protein